MATSRNLLDRVRSQDQSAWSQLVELYAPMVYRWCRAWELPEQDVADIFQDVFRAVASHISEFRKEKSTDTFRGWLRIITRNKVRDHLRKRGREPIASGGTDALRWLANQPEEDDSLIEASDSEAEAALLGRVLELVRCEFEDRTWQAFWKTTVDGIDTAEAARVLAMSRGAIRVAKARVLRRLREEMGDL